MEFISNSIAKCQAVESAHANASLYVVDLTGVREEETKSVSLRWMR